MLVRMDTLAVHAYLYSQRTLTFDGIDEAAIDEELGELDLRDLKTALLRAPIAMVMMSCHLSVPSCSLLGLSFLLKPGKEHCTA